MEIKFLGTGSAEGVPVIGCNCKHCRIALKEKKSRRLRSSILINHNNESILIDAGIDIRQQLLKFNINKINIILITHEHFDHAYGLKEFKFWKGVNKPILCAPQSLLRKISSLYEDAIQCDKLTLKPIKPYIFTKIGSFQIKPVRIIHTNYSFGYVIKTKEVKFVYLSDIAAINPSIMKKYKTHLLNSTYLVINTPFFIGQKGKHMGVFDAIELGKKLNSRYIILNHFNHYNKPYNELSKLVKGNALISFDGMVLKR